TTPKEQPVEQKPAQSNVAPAETEAALRPTLAVPPKEEKPTQIENVLNKKNSDEFATNSNDTNATDTNPSGANTSTTSSASNTTTAPNVVASAIGMAGEARTSTVSTEAIEGTHLVGHIGWVRSLQFSSDGNKALSGGSDLTVRTWDLTTGKELHRFDGHEDV